MPIQLVPIPTNEVMHGYIWTLKSEEELARLVARLLLGHYLHVEKLLAGRNLKATTVDGAAAKAARARLTVKQGQESWHRDGLLFQAISWVAAHKAADPSLSVFSLPHQIPAHKGFDGLQVELNKNGRFSGLIIFEDKATENPRSTIKLDVWPAIQLLETGQRQNELMQETTALLQRAQVNNPDKIIEGIVWNRLRKFRVSITGGPGHDSNPGLAGLFKDYDSVAPGNDVGKRRAEVICFADLRSWMRQFATKVRRAIDGESGKK